MAFDSHASAQLHTQALAAPRAPQANNAPQGYGQISPFTDQPQRSNPTPGSARGGSAVGRNPASGQRPQFPASYSSIPAVKRPFQPFFNPFANPLGAAFSQGKGIGTLQTEDANGLQFGGNQGDMAQMILKALGGM